MSTNVVLAGNVQGLLSVIEFKKQKYMTKEQIRVEADAYNKSLKRHPSSEQALTEVLVEFAERLQLLQQTPCKTLLPHDLKLLEKLWYGRNPCHEANADSGGDMFWGTVACVIDDYITAVNRQ